MSHLVTALQFARLVGVSDTYVYRLARMGEFPPDAEVPWGSKTRMMFDVSRQQEFADKAKERHELTNKSIDGSARQPRKSKSWKGLAPEARKKAGRGYTKKIFLESIVGMEIGLKRDQRFNPDQLVLLPETARQLRRVLRLMKQDIERA